MAAARSGGRLRAVAVLVLLAAFGVGLVAAAIGLIDLAAGKRTRLVIGTKAFTESIILGEIAAQWLEQNGVGVDRRFYLGATNISFEALRSGSIDMYPEYTGTGLIAILDHPPVSPRSAVLPMLRAEFEKRYGLEWLSPLGFNNTYALALPASLADRLHVSTISDLLAHPDLRAGFASEFLARDDGWPGLSRAYGLHFTKPPGSMEAGLMYAAAASDQLDVISAYSTDGRVATQHLKVLEDDRGFFPPYEAAFIVRPDALARCPRAREILEQLAGLIDEPTMRHMNADVDFGNRSPEQVAAEFLVTKGPRARARATSAGAGAGAGAGDSP